MWEETLTPLGIGIDVDVVRRRRYAKPIPHIVRVLERGYGEPLSDTAAAATSAESCTVEEDPCRDLDVTRSLPLSPLPLALLL